MSKWESGLALPSLDKQKRLCEILEIDCSEETLTAKAQAADRPRKGLAAACAAGWILACVFAALFAWQSLTLKQKAENTTGEQIYVPGENYVLQKVPKEPEIKYEITEVTFYDGMVRVSP